MIVCFDHVASLKHQIVLKLEAKAVHVVYYLHRLYKLGYLLNFAWQIDLKRSWLGVVQQMSGSRGRNRLKNSMGFFPLDYEN